MTFDAFVGTITGSALTDWVRLAGASPGRLLLVYRPDVGTTIEKALGYFRKHKHRMRYAKWRREGYPIGSGVVEAACKTLVTQRLKQSGMRWSPGGAQAVLTPRGWDQSERFDHAWALLAATFHMEVTILANVIAFKPKPQPRSSRRASR